MTAHFPSHGDLPIRNLTGRATSRHGYTHCTADPPEFDAVPTHAVSFLPRAVVWSHRPGIIFVIAMSVSDSSHNVRLSILRECRC